MFCRVTIFLLVAVCSAAHLNAQSTAYVMGGGLTIGSQRWDNSQRQALFQWHGTLAVESVDDENDRAALFAQIGYHVKGSTTRFRFFNYSGGVFQTVDRFKFNNISLILGAKQKFPLGGGQARYFYFGGVRGDYTLSTNIDELGSRVGGSFPSYRAIYPFIGYVNRWIFGVSAGVGVQLPFSDLVGVEAKVSVHPDFTYQYNQPPIGNVFDPNTMQTITIGARQIRNTAVELSVCLRLLRKVVYEE